MYCSIYSPGGKDASSILRAEDGQTFLEYGMIITVLSLAGISGLLLFKGGHDGYLTKLADFAQSVL